MKALFVIDMQEEYVGAHNRHGYDSSKLLGKVNDRLDQAQADGDLIIYIQNKKVLKSSFHIPELAVGLHVFSEHIYAKEKASLFSNHKIGRLLKENRISDVEMIGIDGNCCVASSAMDAVEAGLSVLLPCSCIGVKNRERFARKKSMLKDAGIKVIDC